MISACQFGITLASLGLGALAEPLVASLLTGPLAALHVPHELVHPLALAIALTLVSCLHMLLGEMVPKNLALTGPERAAMMLTPPLLLFVQNVGDPVEDGKEQRESRCPFSSSGGISTTGASMRFPAVR
jgi:CBS domain containing-hemolysin-like protein